MIKYNPLNWYWKVAGSTTQVFSSTSLSFVAIANADYVAWLAAGGHPTNISEASDLYDVLIAQVFQPKLAALDTFIPRGLEDYFTAASFDITLLPSPQQNRLASKSTIRTEIASLRTALGL